MYPEHANKQDLTFWKLLMIFWQVYVDIFTRSLGKLENGQVPWFHFFVIFSLPLESHWLHGYGQLSCVCVYVCVYNREKRFILYILSGMGGRVVTFQPPSIILAPDCHGQDCIPMLLKKKSGIYMYTSSFQKTICNTSLSAQLFQTYKLMFERAVCITCVFLMFHNIIVL